MGTWTFSSKQTEREWLRQWADLVATTADLDGVGAPPRVVLAAARVLRDRVRVDEAGRARGREAARRKHAMQAARWEAEILLQVARKKPLGPVVKRHEAARDRAVAIARAAQLAGVTGPSADERRAAMEAGLSRSTVYAVAQRRKK